MNAALNSTLSCNETRQSETTANRVVELLELWSCMEFGLIDRNSPRPVLFLQE